MAVHVRGGTELLRVEGGPMTVVRGFVENPNSQRALPAGLGI